MKCLCLSTIFVLICWCSSQAQERPLKRLQTQFQFSARNFNANADPLTKTHADTTHIQSAVIKTDDVFRSAKTQKQTRPTREHTTARESRHNIVIWDRQNEHSVVFKLATSSVKDKDRRYPYVPDMLFFDQLYDMVNYVWVNRQFNRMQVTDTVSLRLNANPRKNQASVVLNIKYQF